MTKKFITLLAITALLTTFSGLAFAKSFKGEVTQIDGNEITITISKDQAKGVTVGDKAKLSIKKSQAPSAGSDALTGC